MEEIATSLLVSTPTSRVLLVVVLPRLMGRLVAKTVSPLTCCTRARLVVVKLQVTFVPSGVPIASVTVPDTVAVYTVPSASGLVGVRVAMVPVALSATVAGTLAAAPAARRVKVAIVIVAAFTGLLSVAVTVVLRGTPVAPGAGDTAVTASGVVVKLHTEAVPSGVPAMSVTVAATVAGSNLPSANSRGGGAGGAGRAGGWGNRAGAPPPAP